MRKLLGACALYTHASLCAHVENCSARAALHVYIDTEFRDREKKRLIVNYSNCQLHSAAWLLCLQTSVCATAAAAVLINDIGIASVGVSV